MQSFLTRASLSGLNLDSNNLSSLHRNFICRTHVLSHLCQLWETFQTELAKKEPYKASIGGMRLRLAELQESDNEAQEIQAEGLDGYEDVNRVLHHQELPFVPEII